MARGHHNIKMAFRIIFDQRSGYQMAESGFIFRFHYLADEGGGFNGLIKDLIVGKKEF